MDRVAQDNLTADLPEVATPATTQAVPSQVLESLAARFRPSGVYPLLLRPDGTLAYQDSSGAAFFHRYVLPLLPLPRPPLDPVGLQKMQYLCSGSGGVSAELVPGVLLASFPHVEKRKAAGVILLAAKIDGFALGEDVLRACGRLGLDGQWLAQQARDLPSYSPESLQRQGRLLISMLRDQVRLIGLEHELDSLSGQLANTYEELSLIYQISGGMKVNRRAADFFKQACLDVTEVLSVRGVGVSLQSENFAAEPVLYGSINLPQRMVHRLGLDLTALLTERRNSLLIHDLAHDKTFQWLAPYARQLLAVPLQRQEQVLGCLFALDKNVGEFDSVDSKLLNSIANESAIYLENAMLFEDVHGLMMGLLHSLTSAVDAKDAYTCGHSERVALLSRHLALQAHLSDHAVERIYMGGLLHDVGKIGVPESVLQKTGRLTAEEFELMKKHPEIGARILHDIKQIKDIIPGVLYHHERYDGTGYPAGLAGEEIPLMGRIICLADCFDAMTSSRTYRQALPLEVALEEIARCSGSQFDPALSEVFIKIGAPRFRELLREHKEQSKKLVDLQQTLRGA